MGRALMNNDVESFSLMLKTVDFDINEPCMDGYYMLHRAASAGSATCLKYLIKKGADVNVTDINGLTPLDLAVLEGEFDCATYLIRSGA
ncbi:predicted protein, partial [Nematostella vectensis]